MGKKLIIYSAFLCLLFFPGKGWTQVVPTFSDPPPDSTATDSLEDDRIKILNSDLLMFEKVDGIPIQKLIGNVRIQQDSTFFYCDSAYHYETQNRLEAYDNVRIEMSDSVTLTGDRLIYFSDTKIAEVYDNITLTDQEAILTTDRMTYQRVEDFGFYEDGGELLNGTDTLTSKLGYYYPQTKDAFFRGDVVLMSPDYNLETDTLGYNTDTKVAKFLTFTKIISEDGEITTTNGNYSTEDKKINLFERSTVEDSSYVLTADSLRYEDQDNMGYALGNVYIQEEDSSLEIRGQYGQFNRKTDESMVTQDPVAIQFMEDDTLYMFADTLLSLNIKRPVEEADSLKQDSISVGADSLIQNLAQRDSLLKDKPAIDSTIATLPDLQIEKPSAVIPDSAYEQLQKAPALGQVPTDSSSLTGVNPFSIKPPDDSLAVDTLGRRDSVESRVFRAYKNVRLFMNDMQGRADSLIYMFDDSMIYMYQKPVLWADESQITGDSIIIWMKDSKIDSMWVGANAFLASKEDTVGYNQIKGKEMRAKFVDNKLYRLHVIGNSESIYFAKNEDDSTNIFYEGMNQALAQEMFMYFVDNEIQRIVFVSKPEGTFYPFFEVVFKENKLDGLIWRGEERPEKPEIFVKLPGVPIQLPLSIPQSDTSSSPPRGEKR
ncbi:MAG: OstA-like protein [Bacteroidia bacterium]|nr:OstA-like protein [Bacteroidia bacterium]